MPQFEAAGACCNTTVGAACLTTRLLGCYQAALQAPTQQALMALPLRGCGDGPRAECLVAAWIVTPCYALNGMPVVQTLVGVVKME
jgi:hypothetical protein